MADYRYLHKRGSHGERVKALTHLEYRVWTQYVLSADDYGVMRATPTLVRADNPRLEREPLRKVDAALKALESCALLVSFEHQGERFLWQADWQDYQMIRYPRQTPLPAPSLKDLEIASAKTRKLFLEHHRCHSGVISEIEQKPTSARGRETQALTQTPTLSGQGEESAREGGTPPVWNAAGRQGHGRALVGDHRSCFPVPEACGRGICMPGKLGAEFSQQVAGDLGYVEAFVHAVIAGLAPGPIAEDGYRFWRRHWEAKHPSQAPDTSRSSKGERSVKAFESSYAALKERGAL